MIEFSDVMVGATSGDFAVSADGGAPSFEQFAIFDAHVERVGLESGGADSVIPGREAT